MEPPHRRARLLPALRQRRFRLHVTAAPCQRFIDVVQKGKLDRLLPRVGVHRAGVAVVRPAQCRSRCAERSGNSPTKNIAAVRQTPNRRIMCPPVPAPLRRRQRLWKRHAARNTRGHRDRPRDDQACSRRRRYPVSPSTQQIPPDKHRRNGADRPPGRIVASHHGSSNENTDGHRNAPIWPNDSTPPVTEPARPAGARRATPTAECRARTSRWR